MKQLVMWIPVAALALGLAFAAGSCSIEHRSGTLVCEVQADCPSDRRCRDGYCEFTGPIDAGIDGRPDRPDAPIRPDAFACPPQCTTCDLGDMTCNIDCEMTDCTDTANPITCPPGWNCTIACSTPGACRNLDCKQAASCDVTCKGSGSCRDATCGNDAPCDFTCSGEQSCRNVNCDASCGCDVRCDNLTSCPLQNDCPGAGTECETFGNGCTRLRTGCDTCP
ncbi:MAG: hypothetical protein WKG01_25895 [Kofleriaceae bacterium]